MISPLWVPRLWWLMLSMEDSLGLREGHHSQGSFSLFQQAHEQTFLLCYSHLPSPKDSVTQVVNAFKYPQTAGSAAADKSHNDPTPGSTSGLHSSLATHLSMYFTENYPFLTES